MTPRWRIMLRWMAVMCWKLPYLKQIMETSTVDERYRDLQKVERNFRTMKTGLLEIRPIYLRHGDEFTKAHVFIALLALKVARVFESQLHQSFDRIESDNNALTVPDALQSLSRIIFLNNTIKGQTTSRLTALDEKQSAIFKALGLTFPSKKAKCRQ